MGRTSSVAHLTENLKAVDLALPEAAVARLDQIGRTDCSVGSGKAPL